MEDLYDNLDNYNDLNIIQELRSENHDLKDKLEEKTLAIEKLQNDYDHLNMEFKNLEINYSSLLKTARAEIERKTQIINNLNIEKDMIVLNALQNGTNVRRSFRNTNNFKKNTNVTTKQDDHKIKEETQKINDIRDRKGKPGTQSNEIGSTILNTEKLNSKVEPSRQDKLNECKENHIQLVDRKIESFRPRAGSIRNRRKSMPVGSMKSRFSDDESDQNFDKEIIQRDILPVRKLDRRLLDKAEEHTSKTSEPSKVEDRNFNHEPLRESYRNRQDRNRYPDSDRLRNRNRQDNSQRNRKYSPVRAPRRVYDPRSSGRHRVLESPPLDPYLAKTWYSRHDRNNEYQPKSRFEDKQPYKHKIPYDNEPHGKRQKIEENRASKHSAQEKPCDNRELETIPAFSPFELDTLESCQSPDYAQIETALGHTVKEIRNVAAVPLEDPRIRSGKYALKPDADGKSTLCTTTGRNVNIIPINKIHWNLEHVNVPRALICHPSTMNDDTVEKIYSDIDKVFNMSLESGEIFTPDDINSDKLEQNEDCPMNKKETVQKTTKAVSKLYKIPKNKHNEDNTHDGKEIISMEGCIDKPVNANRTCSELPERLIERHDELPLNIRSKVLIESKEECDNRDTVLCKGIVEGDLELSDENSDNTESNNTKFFQNSYVPTPSLNSSRDQLHKKDGFFCPMANYSERNVDSVIVSGQSEKNSNARNIETTKQKSFPLVNTSATENVNSEINSVETREFTDKINSTAKSNCIENEHKVSVTNLEADKEVVSIPGKCEDNVIKQMENVGKSSDNKKKSKSKKSSAKTKESKCKELDKNHDKISEIKTQLKKVKEKRPKEVKQKFSDLFGDSGSLITPEDLGLGSYVPMFEDAQDATDLNINKVTQKCALENKNEIKDLNKDNYEPIAMHIDSGCKKFQLNHQTKIIDSKTSTEAQNNVEESVSDDIKTKICKKNELPPEISSTVFKNINLHPLVDKPDVVKTIIISTGTQPHINLETDNQRDPAIPDTVTKTGGEQSIARKIEIKKEYLKALATSTPYKDVQAYKSVENNTESVDNNEALTACESSSSTVDTFTKTDEPDVRIIVKRRRKVAKKPAVT